MEKIKTLFFGSGEFAVPILEQLLNFEFVDVAAVVTQPDKPAGRKQQLQPVPVKDLLEKFYPQVPVYIPALYRVEQEEILDTEKPELIIVADYGQILPESTINYPKYKCLNVHGSLLPDLRGAVPIPLAILNGYKKIGVSIPIMTAGLDDGPVVASSEREIEPDDTTLTLKQKLAEDGAKLLIEILPAWIAGELAPVPQDETKATIADKSLISKDKARFGSDITVVQLDRMVRAFNPWPVAWCEVEINKQKKRLKVFSAKVVERDSKPFVGKIKKSGKGVQIILSDGALELVELQLEGKTIGRAEEYRYLDEVKIV